MTKKDYFFQLTKKDLEDIAKATDPKPGFCVKIENTADCIKIGLDENALKLAINGFFRNGGCNTRAAGCVDVPFDPPS
jgi:hypothetical protein